MEEKFVMNVMQTILNSQNEISIDDYNMIVKYFDKTEEYEFSEILKKNNISIVEKRNTTKKNKSEKKGEKPLLDVKKISMSNEKLCELYQQGEEKALDLLWMKNDGLVRKIVNRYSNKYRTILEDEDLNQCCFMGFKKAVEKFDSSKDVKFSTYVVWWLRQSVTRAIADTGTLIRIPVHKWDEVGVVKKYINEYSYCNKNEVIDIINEKEGYDKFQIEEDMILVKNLLNPNSLDYLIGEKEDTDFYEVLVDESQKSVEESVIENDLKEEIEICLDCLTEKEKDILKKRVGLHDGKKHTLEEIGHDYGITRERIRQIEKKAIRKLRRNKRARSLKIFMEE